LRKPKVRGALVAAAHDPDGFPESRAPVVALVGRSNVGKSSLLNRLLKTTAARVGRTPGKTRGIYFYEAEDGHLFADLPGAGYARVSRAEREAWARLAEALFASGRVSLAVRLVDARVPDAAVDREMRDWLDGLGVPVLAVATKWDRLSASERALARRRLEAVHGRVVAVSARTGEGIDHLRREILQRIQPKKDDAHG
jgi:GTP-binding protein